MLQTRPSAHNNKFIAAMILGLFALPVCLAAVAQNMPATGPAVSAKARQIHDSAIVIDTPRRHAAALSR